MRKREKNLKRKNRAGVISILGKWAEDQVCDVAERAGQYLATDSQVRAVRWGEREDLGKSPLNDMLSCPL